jgi:hypothetical protein
MRALSILVAALLAGSAGAAEAQRIVARVVDAESREPLAGVTVKLLAADSTVLASAETRDDGFFLVAAPARGEYRLLLDRLGYASTIQRVVVVAGDVSLPAITMRTRALPLDTVARMRAAFVRTARPVSGSVTRTWWPVRAWRGWRPWGSPGRASCASWAVACACATWLASCAWSPRAAP